MKTCYQGCKILFPGGKEIKVGREGNKSEKRKEKEKGKEKGE